MLTGEVRVFTDPQYWPELRMGVFGNAACADTQGMVICAAGTAGLEGTPHPLLGPDHVATLDAPATGAALLPFLGFGWKTDAQGSIWSEGPRAALVLRSTAPGDRTLVLDLTGISFSAGGTRDVTVSMNGTNLATAALADMQASQIAVTLPARLLVGGIAWIALDVQRPVDPVRRTIAAPVNRSALRLGRIGWAN
jgi:hypothetical protein